MGAMGEMDNVKVGKSELAEIVELNERIAKLESELTACRDLRNRLEDLWEQTVGLGRIQEDIGDLREALNNWEGSDGEENRSS